MNSAQKQRVENATVTVVDRTGLSMLSRTQLSVGIFICSLFVSPRSKQRAPA